MATSEEIDEFKDLYDVAGLTDEEISLIIGEAEGKRSRLDEQRLMGETMRSKGRPGGSYDPRTGVQVSGGLLGLGGDIFERFVGHRQEKEASEGLEGMEADDQDRMRLRINRLRTEAQDRAAARAAQGPMGPPGPVAPQGATAAPGMVDQGPLQAPQPSIPEPQLNIPQDEFAIDPTGASSRGQGVVTVGDIPPPPAGVGPQGEMLGDMPIPGQGLDAQINAELPPIGAASAGTPSGMAGLTPEEQSAVQKWLQGLRR